MFGVGQPVECIDARGGGTCLRSKQVYTCLAVEPEFMRVDCCADPNHENHRWFVRRFRPIVDKATDISFAHEILRKTSKTKETAA